MTSLAQSMLSHFILFVYLWGPSSAKDSFKFLTRYLATFSDEDAYALSEAKEEAVRAIVDFVKAPDMFQVSLVCLFALHINWL